MGAEALGREERPLEMDAEDPRALRGQRHGAECRDELLLRRGDQRRQVGGDAGLEQRVAGACVAGRVGVEEVDAREAVHLEVDEARHGDSAAARARRARPRRSARRRTRRRRERARRRRAPPRRRASWLAAPVARRRRPRRAASGAVAASTPASSETIATFASPPAAASASSTSLGLCARREADDPPHARVRASRSRRQTSTIRFPKVLPSRIIEIVEIMFSTSFCAVPALRRVEPARISAPTATAISWSASRASSEPRTRDDADRQGARGGGCRRARRRRTACGRSR